MKWDVIRADYIGHRCIQIYFRDGLRGVIQVMPEFCTGVFKTLLDEARLEEVYVEDGAVTWPGGLDLAPDTMYRELQAHPERVYLVGQQTVVV